MPPRVPLTQVHSPGFNGRPGSQYGRVSITATIELPGSLTLPDRMVTVLHERLKVRMAEAADAVIEDARMQLQPGHGYDTGLLHESLTKELVDTFLGAANGAEEGVFYDLGSHEAPYWVYVEFGHLTRAGNWWEGYHYLENAIAMNRTTIRRLAYEAWADTIVILAGQSRANLGILSPHQVFP